MPRVSRYSSEQIDAIVLAVEEHGASYAPKYLSFQVSPQVCQYYWRKAKPELPIRRRKKNV
jgi:hypothetical protein